MNSFITNTKMVLRGLSKNLHALLRAKLNYIQKHADENRGVPEHNPADNPIALGLLCLSSSLSLLGTRQYNTTVLVVAYLSLFLSLVFASATFSGWLSSKVISAWIRVSLVWLLLLLGSIGLLSSWLGGFSRALSVFPPVLAHAVFALGLLWLAIFWLAWLRQFSGNLGCVLFSCMMVLLAILCFCLWKNWIGGIYVISLAALSSLVGMGQLKLRGSIL